MANRKLNQYKGLLTPAQTAAGMNASISNAEKLLCDARILYEEGSYSTATSIAILSIEESGKTSILRSICLSDSQEDLNSAWREYRQHTSKNRQWILSDLVKSGARRLGDLRPIFDTESEHPFLLDQVKQIGFYTDCLGHSHWSIPAEVVDKALCERIIQIAGIQIPKRKITEREIELWIKHMKPVWKRGMELMETALIAWHREMCKEGLLSGDPEDMGRFVLGNSAKPQ